MSHKALAAAHAAGVLPAATRLRISADMLKLVDRLAAQMARDPASIGAVITRSDALRAAIIVGCRALLEHAKRGGELP